MFEELTVRLNGLAPLIMHNGQLADPLNPFTKQLKAVTGKRKKTDEDHAEIARIEWHASLYVDADGHLCMPGENLEACLIAGAKKSKLGTQFKSAVFVDGQPRVNYGGKKKAAELWGDPQYRDIRGVRVTTSRTMRCRPIFRTWSIEMKVKYNPDLVNKADVLAALNDAGMQAGLGDYRPKFGRFEVEVLN
jgi:hypothetical protein